MSRNKKLLEINPITNYFQNQKSTTSSNIQIQQTNEQNSTICEDFYKECLTEKLCECKMDNCVSEKQRLKLYLANCENTLKQVNLNVDRIGKTLSRKETTISKLEAKIQNHQLVMTAAMTTTTNSSTGTTISNVLTTSNTDTTPTAATKKTLFSTFSEKFSTMELAEFRSIGSAKPNDSTFVLKIIRSLYRNELTKIDSISVSGRSRKGESKEKMSEQNFEIVKDMLAERLESLNLVSNEYACRKKLVGAHIKNAFANIIHTKKSQKVDDDETIRKINDQFNS